MQYLLVLRGLVMLYVTGIEPLRASYTQNAIIPFPINEECIKTFEMAMMMPTSANFFYEYLETLCG
jgi:Regulator of G protein signaling domain